jgi:hypothetical protein
MLPCLSLSDCGRLESAMLIHGDIPMLRAMLMTLSAVTLTVSSQLAVSTLQWVIDHELKLTSLRVSACHDAVNDVLKRANVSVDKLDITLRKGSTISGKLLSRMVTSVTITKEYLQGQNFRSELWSFLNCKKLTSCTTNEHLEMIRTLIQSNTQVCNIELTAAGSFPSFVEVRPTLRVITAEVTDTARHMFLVHVAAKCPNLRELYFRVRRASPTLDDDVITVVRSCTQLEVVSLQGVPLGGRAIVALAKHAANLRKLHVDHGLLCNVALQALSVARTPLTSLCVAWCVLSLLTVQQGAAVLSGLQVLCITEDTCASATEQRAHLQTFCSALPYMSALQTLEVQLNTPMQCDTLRTMALCCHQLITLHLLDRIYGGDEYQSALIALLTANPALQVLHCTRAPLTDRVLSALAQSCPGLTELRAESSKTPGDAGMGALARGCHWLHTVLLPNSCTLTDAAVSALTQHCPHLHTLDVSQCRQLQEPALVLLVKGCRKLISLRIAANCLSKATADLLQQQHEARGLQIERTVPSSYLLSVATVTTVSLS